MKLNLRVNDYPIILDQELNEAELKKHNFKKVGLLDRLLIKPSKNEIVWWSKNCGLKYLNDDFQNSIYPILDIKAGAEIMYGTSAYLWHKENKLIKFTFQIIQNKMAAEISLKKLEEKGWQVIKPYQESTVREIQLYWKILNYVLIREDNKETGKIELKHPTIAQAEYILWKFEGYQNWQESRGIRN